MIRLEVQDYCHNCPEFEPDVERPHAIRTGHGDLILSDTVIRCERTDICAVIYKRARKEAETMSFMQDLAAYKPINDDSARTGLQFSDPFGRLFVRCRRNKLMAQK